MRRVAIVVSAGLVGLGALCSAVAGAATITVTTTAEDPAANDPGCSLREAIIAANRGAPRGGCRAGDAGVQNTIVLRSGATYTFTQPDQPEPGEKDRASWFGPNGLPPIASSIVIDGNGATIAGARRAPRFVFSSSGPIRPARARPGMCLLAREH